MAEEGSPRVYSVAEAAKLLKRTPKTIRAWLRDGKLTGHKVEIPGGFAWRIELPEGGIPGGEEVAEPASPTVQVLLGILTAKDAEIARLNSQVAQLTGTAAMYQERASHLALEAPRSRSWWRRLWPPDKH